MLNKSLSFSFSFALTSAAATIRTMDDSRYGKLTAGDLQRIDQPGGALGREFLSLQSCCAE